MKKKKKFIRYLERTILALVALNLIISIVEVSKEPAEVVANNATEYDHSIDSLGTNVEK